jgi:hypothetical protein
MIIKGCLIALLIGATTQLATIQAMAAEASTSAEPLLLMTDQTRILKLPRPAGTIVVGNPTFADVTVQGNLVFLHGRAFGTTNIIILDDAGDQLAEFEATVQMGGSNNLALYKAGMRFSHVCAPNFEATLQVCDPRDWLIKELSEEILTKSNLATGKTATDATQTDKTGDSGNNPQ